MRNKRLLHCVASLTTAASAALAARGGARHPRPGPHERHASQSDRAAHREGPVTARITARWTP